MRRLVLLAAAVFTLGPAAARAAPEGSPWGAQYWPNIELVTHEGKTVRFYDDLVKDKHVVLSFIFTNCTKQCGLMTANLARIQRVLGDRVGKDVLFYSITMDPDRDTPEVLARYRKAFKAGPGWVFLTGKEEEIELLRKKVGDLAPREDHSTHVAIGNDAIGQWMATSVLDNPVYLAGVIGDWLDPSWETRKPRNSYADAPDIRKPSKVETLWGQKCQACHLPHGQSVGPDLAGVTKRRDREWLRRWIAAPEKLVAAKDPTALALLEKHGDVQMPNVGLSDEQVGELLDFLEGLKPAPALGQR